MNENIIIDEKISHNLKLLNLIMTCCIVFYHVGDYYNEQNNFDDRLNNIINSISSNIGIIAMSYFFAVTGFLLFHNLTQNTFLLKIKHRFFSLLIPYFLWQCIITLINIFFGQQISIFDFIEKTFLFIKWPIDGPLWYVYAVFFLAVYSPLLLLLFYNKKLAFLTICTITILIENKDILTNTFLNNFINYGYIPNILLYFPSYMIGAFYGKFYSQKLNITQLKYVFILISISLLLNEYNKDFFILMLLKMLPIIIIIILPLIPYTNTKFIYKLTFLIYALHSPIMNVSKYKIDELVKNLILPNYLINIIERFVNLGIIICFSAIIYTLLKIIYPQLLNLLTGNRN